MMSLENLKPRADMDCACVFFIVPIVHGHPDESALLFTICTTHNSTYMLFTHITQDCITKQYEKVAKQALHPIIHEISQQKNTQPSASL